MAYLTLDRFIASRRVPRGDVEALTRLGWSKSEADELAATETVEQKVGDVDSSSAVEFIQLVPDDVVVAHASNHAAVELRRRARDGSIEVLGLTDTSATSWAPNVPITIAPLVELVAGDVVTVEIAKEGTGVVLPAFRIDLLPAVNWFTLALAARESFLHSRIGKRYAWPFAAPVPSIVPLWLIELLTYDAFAARGFNPGSAQDQDAIIGRYTTALEQMKEAADAKDGLFELPLREDLAGSSAVSRGGPLSYSEQSPYTAFDRQRVAVRDE